MSFSSVSKQVVVRNVLYENDFDFHENERADESTKCHFVVTKAKAGNSEFTFAANHQFSVFTSPWSKLKIVTIQWIKSRIWDTMDDWYINNLAKNQVSAVFHSRVICRSVSPKFIELCMETPCLCPFEGLKHGGRNVTETSVTEFCHWNAKLLL